MLPRSFCLASATVALLLLFCSSSTAQRAPAATQRVRKELRDLTPYELNLYVEGLSVMLAVSTATGQRRFGPAYREYDWFVVKHAVTVYDPRGDQGHAAPCFLTFHRALLLEFEASLLSVVPELGAMPYWDVLRDVRGGWYPVDHPKYIFSGNFAGSINTDPNLNYTVTDGVFPWRRISRFSVEKYAGVSPYFTGSQVTGLLRARQSANDNLYITRYPSGTMRQEQPSWYVPDPRPNELPLDYTRRDWALCFNTTLIKSVQHCQGNPLPPVAPWPPQHDRGRNDAGVRGDFSEAATSPNDVFMFMLHHANIDRSAMIWQTAAANFDPTMASREVLWKFWTQAQQNAAGPNYYDVESGCYLNDVVSRLVPFNDIFPGQRPQNPEGFTHAEVLWYTRPGAVAYTYADMRRW